MVESLLLFLASGHGFKDFDLIFFRKDIQDYFCIHDEIENVVISDGISPKSQVNCYILGSDKSHCISDFFSNLCHKTKLQLSAT